MTRSFWNRERIGFSVSNSEGMSGDIISLWNTDKVDVLFSLRGEGFLVIKVMWEENLYYVCNVYSSCVLSDKRKLWKNLLDNMSQFHDGEWILDGDFNAIKTSSERKGRNDGGSKIEWEKFSCFIRDSGLEDVPCKGKKFSWYSVEDIAKSRTDRFLISPKVLNDWGVVGQLIGMRVIFDHFPCCLIADRYYWGSKS